MVYPAVRWQTQLGLRQLVAGGSGNGLARPTERRAWVLAGLRHQRARESGLIYEAYYDAFRSDIPRDAGDQLPGR
jgi:hypothetical protein